MTTVDKNAAIGALGLPSGDHWVKFYVEGDAISFDVAASKSAPTGSDPQAFQPTGFVERWGGTARKLEDSSDPWITHINEKHLR